MFKILIKECEPTRGSKHSACVDLYASEDIVIGSGETKLVGLGVAIDLNTLYRNWYRGEESGAWRDFLNSHYLALHPRSSLRAKGLISNTGIIDLDYADEIKIIIHNPILGRYENDDNGNGFFDDVYAKEFKIKKGDRIAQITLLEHKSHLFGIETEDERNGGFGSTREK